MQLRLRAKIYTVAGELVKTLEGTAGYPASLTWDTTGLSSGLYLAMVDELDPASGAVLEHQVVKVLVVR